MKPVLAPSDSIRGIPRTLRADRMPYVLEVWVTEHHRLLNRPRLTSRYRRCGYGLQQKSASMLALSAPYVVGDADIDVRPGTHTIVSMDVTRAAAQCRWQREPFFDGIRT